MQSSSVLAHRPMSFFSTSPPPRLIASRQTTGKRQQRRPVLYNAPPTPTQHSATLNNTNSKTRTHGTRSNTQLAPRTTHRSVCLGRRQRLVVASVVKRWVHCHLRKAAFVIEHDLVMASTLADRVIDRPVTSVTSVTSVADRVIDRPVPKSAAMTAVSSISWIPTPASRLPHPRPTVVVWQVISYSGRPAIECTAHAPTSVARGFNRFLAQIDLTVRRDPANMRPRINKRGGGRDREQRAAGVYFVFDADDDDNDD